MKALIFAAAFLIFNISMSVVVHSGVLTGTTFYESEYINQYNDMDFDNLSKTQIDAQSMDIFTLAIHTVTFNWIYDYIPKDLHSHFEIFVIGLNALGMFLIAVAAIELFTKGSTPLLGG